MAERKQTDKPPHSKYFEGILQLRNPTQELLDYVEDEADERRVFITNIIKQEDGVDLYMTSQRFIQKLGRNLSKRFCGELKISPQLFSRDAQTSKDIYRVNVLFRQMNICPGKIVEIRGKKYKIKTVGANISAIDTDSGRRVILKHKELEKILNT